MQRYSKYKSSDIDWISEIPNHWELTKLKYHFAFEKGKEAAKYTNEYIGTNQGEFPVYSGQTENEGVLGRINSFDYEFRSVLFVTTVGAKAMTLKLLSGKFSLSQNCALISNINQNVNNRFYNYYLQRHFDFEKGRISLIMQPSLRFEDLNSYQIYLPPLEEQTTIANFLDEKTSQIDKLISNKQKLIELLKEERTAIINEAVSGKGKNWEKKKLKYVGKAMIGITYSPDDITTDEGSILVLRSSNIQNGKLSFLDNVYVNKELNPKYFTQKGDILICARNGSAHLVGKCALINTASEKITWGAFMSIFRSEYGEYLYHYFNSDLFRRNIGLFSTSTVFQLTSETLNNLVVAFPKDEKELKQTIEHIQTETQRIDNLISKMEKEIELMNEYRTALISEVVTGKIKVV